MASSASRLSRPRKIVATASVRPALGRHDRNAVERAKHTDLSVGATEVSRPSRWVGSPKQVAEDAQELYEVYWNTFSGLIQSNVCASCGKPLGLDRINDGVDVASGLSGSGCALIYITLLRLR